MKILALAFCFLSLFLPGDLSQASPHMDQAMPGMRSMRQAPPLPGMSIYNLQGRWTTQDGVTEPLSALRGRPMVAAMVYSHCRDICPLTVERMQEVERKLPADERDSVLFVLFSLDWSRDTPDQLRRFASQHQLDRQRWTLFHGNQNAVRELAGALGVSFYRGTDGDLQHSIAIFAIDAEGVVKREQDDLQQPAAAIAAAIRKLLKEAGQKSVRAQ